MKQLIAVLLVFILTFSANPGVNAQGAETIWIETSKESYSTGESITVTLKANTGTPIQGFSFQLVYDPACLQPTIANGLLPGLNYMAVPQTVGRVDGIFASTTPLQVNGALVEVKFQALASCQTSLKLEEASLSVADASGMAVSLPGISLGTSSLVLTVVAGGATRPAPTGQPTVTPQSLIQPTMLPETSLPAITITQPDNTWNWILVPLGILMIMILFTGLVVTAVFMVRERRKFSEEIETIEVRPPTFFIQRGPQAGKTLTLTHFPCRIGSDPASEICLQDTRIAPTHAEILADQYGYTLVDLGSEDGTHLNGKLIKNQQSLLKPGDTLRMGGIVMVFAAD